MDADRPAMVAEPWRRAQRLLAVRLDNLGDVLMTTPALAALRESLPHARLTLLTSPAGASAADHLPMVDEVLGVDAPWVKGSGEAAVGGGDARPGAAEAALIRQLADARFDAAVVFTVSTQSALPAALLCRLAGIPLRLAYSRENPYALLSDWVRETDAPGPAQRHEVRRQLDLVAAVGLFTGDERLRFRLRDADRAQAARQLAAAGLRGQPYVVLHPGATAASRRWPAQRFGLAAEAVARSSGCAVVFAGDAQGDVQRVEVARAVMGVPSVSLAGRLSLGGLAALIEGARLLMANNSAPAHLAAAVGTPVVSLYALTNPQHTPWQVPVRVLSHDVPCRWCLKSVCPQPAHGCLAGVSAERAAAESLALMRETAALTPAAPTHSAAQAPSAMGLPG